MNLLQRLAAISWRLRAVTQAEVDEALAATKTAGADVTYTWNSDGRSHRTL